MFQTEIIMINNCFFFFQISHVTDLYISKLHSSGSESDSKSTGNVQNKISEQVGIS